MYFRFCASPIFTLPLICFFTFCIVISVKNASTPRNVQGGNLASILEPSSPISQVQLAPRTTCCLLVSKYVHFSAFLWPLTEYKRSVCSPGCLYQRWTITAGSGLIGPAQDPSEAFFVLRMSSDLAPCLLCFILFYCFSSS